MVRNWLTLILFLTSTVGLASPASLVYQGQIIKPNGHALEAASVTFKVEVFSPGAEECLLYEESHIVNMVGSKGIFGLPLGEGIRAGSDFEDTATLIQAFDNSSGTISPTTCSIGSTYTPTASDRRKIRLTFDDGTGAVQIASQDIHSAPFALSAASVGGLVPANILQVNTSGSYVLDQSNLENIFENSNYTELLALIGGTSSQYMVSAPSSAVDFNGQQITSVATPSSGTDAANKNYVDQNIGGQAVDGVTIAALGAAQDGQVLVWDGIGGRWTTAAPAGDSTKLPLAGGTMTGAINMGAHNISNANDIALNNNLSVGGGVSVTGGIGVGTGINSGGPIQLTNQNELRLGDADNSNYIGLAAPATVSTDTTFILPDADGSNGQMLTTNGSGQLIWATDAGGDVTGGANVGAGAGQIFRDEVTGVLNFKSIAAGSSKLSVTNNANDISLDVVEANINHDNLAGFVANEHIDHSGVSIGTAADSGLAGGGDITASRALSVDISGTTALGAAADNADTVLIYDDSGSV
ncbi:MAG: hypothetical protein KDD33_08970, partial [Bdellovibrionales bacterium]|nr:hypothetical protein [Bdellovibrionales bacterium]